MTVRVFSSSVITLDEGTLDTIQNGAFTFAAIFKRSGSTTDGTQFLLSLNSGVGANQRLAFSYSSASALQTTLNGTSRTFGASFTIANNTWYCFVVTKASGTATPRANLYKYTAGTWAGWTNGNGTVDNNADANVQGQVGNAPNGFPLNGKIACMGMWSSVLSDTNAETLETAAQNWFNLSPAAMWRFNQASTATAVVDDTGNGADQTAISGTSVDTGDDPPGFDFSLGGGATDLVAADAGHAHTVDQPTLTQVHSLAAADATHAQTAEQPALSQVHVIAVNDASHGHTADAPAVTQAHALAVADASHQHAAESAPLTQTHVLAVSNTAHTQTAGEPTLVQGQNVAVQDAAHEHTVDQAALTQLHALTAADASHAHTADQPSLVQVHTIAPADATHAHTAGNVTVTGAGDITAHDANHVHTAGQPALTQIHEVGPSAATHAQAADQASLTVGSTITVDEASHSQTAESPKLAQQHVIAVDPAVHEQVAGQAAVTQLHVLVATDASHTHTATQSTVVPAAQSQERWGLAL